MLLAELRNEQVTNDPRALKDLANSQIINNGEHDVMYTALPEIVHLPADLFYSVVDHSYKETTYTLSSGYKTKIR